MTATVEDLQGLTLSAHARRAMRARDVWPEEVARVLLEPEVVTAGEGSRRFVAGDLAVVLSDGPEPVVLTVLLRSRDRWTDEDARNRHTTTRTH